MYRNGYLPASVLAPIGGGYYLVKDAAAAFNAMSQEAVHRWGRPITVISAYRDYATQVYLWNHVAHAHDTNWVAYPGTSNHGWGLAVDLSPQWCRWAVDQIGAKYGFSKSCSDAPVEWWHIKYNPVCTGATWKPGPPAPRVLKYGMHGQDVKDVQTYLVRGGYLDHGLIDGSFGGKTVYAVRAFQEHVHLPTDGTVGPKTLAALKRRYSWAVWHKEKK